MAEETIRTPIGTAFDRLAEDAGHRPAVTFGGVTHTRSEIAQRSNQMARRLASLGVGVEDIVTIGLPNGPRFFEWILACLKVGATPQPVSYRLPSAEFATIIEVADPKVVIGFEECDGRSCLVGDEPLLDFDDGPLPETVSPGWKAMTSGGSTGRPKLILSTTPGYVEFVLAAAPVLRIRENEVLLCTGPLYHNGPFLSSFITLMLGGHVVVMERFDAARTLALIEEYEITYLYLVPTMMSRILSLPEEERLARDVSSVRTAYHMAAPCPPHVKQSWIDWLGAEVIVEMYGGTEGQAITVISGDEWLTHRGSVGRVASGAMKVATADGKEVTPGKVGLVWMRPANQRPTYHYIGAEPVAKDGWETLGDMGWLDDEGFLYLTDRESDMILVGGANVYPAEVEAAIEEHPDVLSCCVIGLPDDEYGSVVHAIVETKREVSDADLKRHLEARLVKFKIPRTFERADAPLRDDAGKVRRSALRDERLQALSTEV